MADPWDKDPVVRERNDLTLDAVIDVTNLSQQERLNLRPGQRVSINGVETRLSGSPVQDNSGVPVAEGLNVSVEPWANDPIAPEPTASQSAAQQEALRRIPATDDVARENTLMNGVLLSGGDELAGRLAQGGQMVTNLGRQLQGQPIEVNSSDLNDAVVNRYRQSTGDFAQTNPIQSGALTLAGGALTGGATLGAGVAGATATGAAYGGGSGFLGSQGGFAERLPGAALGGAGGAVLGGAVQGVGQVASPYVQRLGGILTGVARPVSEAGARMFGRRPEPGVVASRRLTDQLRRSGSVNDVTADIERYRSAGLNPSVLDVGGDNVAATVRAAASGEGVGRQIAGDYRDRVASELSPRTIERTRRLTPEESRDSFTLAGDLTRARNAAARNDYGPAYAEQIVVPDVALRALRGNEGTEAMQQARRIASVEQDFDTMEEIDRLLVADLDAAPVASGRALEYVRRAYADIAADAPQELAQGFRSRLEQLDAGLDEIPGLRAARGNYRQASEQIDAVGGSPRGGRQVLGRPDRAPQSALNETTPRYAGYTESLRAPSVPMNQVYQRDQLVNRLAQAREGAVGPLNTITPGARQPLTENSPYVARNLESTFPGQGQRYQQDIDLARQQMTRANFVDPDSNSKSANVLIDQGAEQIANAANGAQQLRGQTVFGLASQALSAVARRAGGLNEAERSAIVQLGLGSADDLQRIIQIADESRRLGRPPPREVRAYLVRTRNALGAQNPVTQQLEQLLLPSRVLAEEEDQ